MSRTFSWSFVTEVRVYLCLQMVATALISTIGLIKSFIQRVGEKTNSVAALWWNQQKLFLFVVDSRHFGGLLNPLKLHSRYKYWTGKILQFKSLLCNTEWDLSFGLLEVSFAIFLSTQFFVPAYIFKGTFSFQRILSCFPYLKYEF